MQGLEWEKRERELKIREGARVRVLGESWLLEDWPKSRQSM